MATGIGSMPGTDPVEAARVVAGELPELMPFPELPARGAGADVLGRAAALLVDLAVEVVPTGYRVTARPGQDHRRAVDLLRWDLDAVEQAVDEAGTPRAVKIQAAGPWTLVAGIELERGHRVLTDPGALRDFVESLTEGVIAHADEVARRTGSRVVVQLDEPSLPTVLSGDVPTPSGYGTVPAVPEPEARRVLGGVVDRLAGRTGHPVIVHCCAERPPVNLLRRAGAGAISLDATRLGEVTGPLADELGETWQEGVPLLLGLIPTSASDSSVRALARPGLDVAARLGFPDRVLLDSAAVTPACGLAGATPDWARQALRRAREVGELYREETGT